MLICTKEKTPLRVFCDFLVTNQGMLLACFQAPPQRGCPRSPRGIFVKINGQENQMLVFCPAWYC